MPSPVHTRSTESGQAFFMPNFPTETSLLFFYGLLLTEAILELNRSRKPDHESFPRVLVVE